MKPKRRSPAVGRRARVVALLLGGLSLGAGASAETLCRNPADQSRAEALYMQAQQRPKTAEAVTSLQESIELCPGIFQSRYALADTLLQQKRYAEAETAANQAISTADPKDWEKRLAGWVLVANAQSGQGRWGEAKAIFDVNARALLQSRVAPPWFNRAYADFEEALAARKGLKANEITGVFRSQRLTGAAPRIALRVEFDYDKATLTAQGQAQLQEVARAMDDEAARAFSFRVIGHTDERGTPEYNQNLSERRAQAAVAELSRLQPGLGQRLHPEGRGQNAPRIPHAADEAQHAVNRRVEFEAK
ncbi:MAG: OmpA family protein [Albidovulum sp.]